jgi:hypothetical protein
MVPVWIAMLTVVSVPITLQKKLLSAQLAQQAKDSTMCQENVQIVVLVVLPVRSVTEQNQRMELLN